MARGGKTLKIETIKYQHNGKPLTVINQVPFRGRPIRVYSHLVDFGIQKEFFNEKEFYKAILMLGFDRGYIDDLFLMGFVMDYFIADRNWSKAKRIAELYDGDKKCLKNSEFRMME